MEILWLILLVAFAIVEGVTVSLVSVWFIGGAAAALIAALCGAEVWLQVVLFFGVFISLDQNSSIFNIVSYAWAGFGASFGPLMLCSLYWRRTTLLGAVAGMVTGAVTVVVWNMFVKPLGGWFGVYELLPGFVIALAVIVVVSLLTKEPSDEIKEEFDTYMDLDV